MGQSLEKALFVALAIPLDTTFVTLRGMEKHHFERVLSFSPGPLSQREIQAKAGWPSYSRARSELAQLVQSGRLVRLPTSYDFEHGGTTGYLYALPENVGDHSVPPDPVLHIESRVLSAFEGWLAPLNRASIRSRIGIPFPSDRLLRRALERLVEDGRLERLPSVQIYPGGTSGYRYRLPQSP